MAHARFLELARRFASLEADLKKATGEHPKDVQRRRSIIAQMGEVLEQMRAEHEDSRKSADEDDHSSRIA
jgi:hypothetical protein